METWKLFKFSHHYLSLLVFALLFTACTDKQLEFNGIGSNISGSIAGFSAMSSSSSKLSQSVSAFSCTTPQAEIYSLDANGVRSNSALASTPVAIDGTFTFKNVTSLGIDLQSAQVKYMIAISGCTDPLSRPLTDRKNQEVSWGSSIVEKVSLVEYSGKKALSETQKTEILNLITKLNQISGTSLNAIFTNILSNPTVSAGFQTIFQLPATQLQYSQPTVNTVLAPTSVDELATAAFSASASHWHPSYIVAYIWKLDGTQVSTSANYNYTPSKTSQGLHTVELFIGISNGAGGIDLTKAYVTKSFTLTVNDTYYPVPPALTLATSSPTNSQNVTISMNTGASFADCDSFSTLALTENSLTAPILASAYNITCTSAGSQNINYTLTSNEGMHTLRLWARDNDGNISPTPSTISVILDTTAPVVSITAQPNTESNSTAASFSFSGTDANAIDHYECKLDAGSYATCTSPLSYSSLAAGSHTFSVRAIDVAGNTSSAVTQTWNIDLTAPAIAITTPASNGTFVPTASLSSFTVSGTCSEDTRSVQIAGSISGTATCSGGAWSSSLNLSSLTDGTLSITATHTDAATNSTTTAARTFIKDTLAPSLSVATPATTKGNAAVGNASWTLTEANIAASTTFTVEVYTGSSWISVGTPAATAGSNSSQGYSLTNYSVPSADTTVAKVRVSVTDAAGNSTTVQSENFSIESTPPSLSAFTITQGSTTTVQNIQVNMSATASITNVTHFCLKLNTNTPPSVSDSCWVAVNASPPGLTPALTLSLSNYYYQLGFTTGSYTLYGFVKTDTGLISNLASAGAGTAGVDKATINYTAPSPPTLLNVIAANTDDPTFPVQSTDYAIPSGPVYIKWNASPTGLGSHPISLYYTTDDTNYISVPGASALTNSANGACTPDSVNTSLDDGNTGCFVWSSGAPTSYFRIRVVVTNTGNLAVSALSANLNTTNIRTLAGNTDPGVGSSAIGSVLAVRKSSNAPFTQQFVVMPSGMIVLIDTTYGLMSIDPTDGKYQILIPNGGTTGTEGDGGSIASAKVKNPLRLIMDYQNNLYIWDDVRIRKISTQSNPWTIQTIIGGGASSNDDIAATSLAVGALAGNQSWPLFQVRPNGKIYLVANHSNLFLNNATPPYIWVYDPTTSKVNRFLPGGNGYMGNPAASISSYGWRLLGMAFSTVDSSTTSIYGMLQTTGGGTIGSVRLDTSTYQATTPIPAANYSGAANVVSGMDGSMYHIGIGLPVSKWNNSTTAFATAFGPTGSGTCPDGTALASCKMQLYDLFVDANGKAYWNDAGMIRTTDQNNNVVTIAGQSLFYGDGLSAISARIGQISRLVRKSTGEIAFLDPVNYRIRQLNNDGTMSLLAGNSSNSTPDTASLANAQGIAVDIWVDSYGLGINASDEIIYNRGKKIARISSSTGKWVDLAGLGTTSHLTGDSGTTQFNSAAYYPKIIGMMGNSIVAGFSGYNSQMWDGLIKSFDISTGVQSHFGGITGATGTTWPAAGQSIAVNQIPFISSIAPMAYDSTDGVWYTGYGTTMLSLTPNGNRVNLFTDAGASITSVAISRASGSLVVYYCGSGKLKKWNQSTSTITALSWPVASMACNTSLLVDPTDGSLIFGFTQKGLYGVGKYINP